ncbi:MAG: hypothetical protein AAGE52_00475 [Myxococcota bacterium]
MTEEWSDGGFPRDTLVYLLGNLAEVVLQNAMADQSIRLLYREWIRNKPQSVVKPLITTGIHGAGDITLLARPEKNEFCIRCTHSSFEALVPVGFDTRQNRLDGVCVACFEGSVFGAIEFVRALLQQLRLQREVHLN